MTESLIDDGLTGIKDDAAGVITGRDIGDGGVIVSVIPDCDPVSEDQVFSFSTFSAIVMI